MTGTKDTFAGCNLLGLLRRGSRLNVAASLITLITGGVVPKARCVKTQGLLTRAVLLVCAAGCRGLRVELPAAGTFKGARA